MIYSELKNIGGNLNCAGNKELNENSFPALETVGGDIILSEASFTKLPANLKEVKGRGIISKNDPNSLLKSLKIAEAKGIIKGGLFFSD